MEIGGDTNSTDGSEPSFAHSRAEMAHPDFSRGYEWWLMKEARKRNPKILLEGLAWGAPGWIGNGEFFSPDMVDYLLRFIDGARKPYKLDLDYLGVWNEMRYDVPWLKSMKQALLKHSPRTKLVCCDLVPSQDQWSIVSAMLKDHELKDAIAAVTAHYTEIDTAGTAPIASPQAARDAGRPLWASEDHPARNFWRDPHENDWPRGSLLAKLYNENYIERRFTKTEPWAVITSYYDILPAPNSGLMYASAPWSGNYRVQSTIWATAHTTQFAQPGWRYIDSACGYLNGKGSYVTLRSAAKDYSIIIETIQATETQAVTFELASLAQQAVHVWRTNESSAFERIADITPGAGTFRIDLEPGSIYSLTTTTGQGKGSAAPPADSAFPLPYREDFEKTTLGQSPRYLSDQNGAFEVVRCAGRPGRCLQQAVTQEPIWWHKTPHTWNPHTILGNAAWTDYQVTSDVRLAETGSVAVMGRVGPTAYDRKEEPLWPSAYVLVAYSDGRWELNADGSHAPAAHLAAGKAPFTKNWHTLALKFRGTNIQASIDGQVVADLNDGTYSAGMAGIGCGWHQAQFDNFRIDR